MFTLLVTAHHTLSFSFLNSYCCFVVIFYGFTCVIRLFFCLFCFRWVTFTFIQVLLLDIFVFFYWFSNGMTKAYFVFSSSLFFHIPFLYTFLRHYNFTLLNISIYKIILSGYCHHHISALLAGWSWRHHQVLPSVTLIGWVLVTSWSDAAVRHVDWLTVALSSAPKEMLGINKEIKESMKKRKKNKEIHKLGVITYEIIN